MLGRHAWHTLLFSISSIVLPTSQDWSCEMPFNYTPVSTALSGDVVEPVDGDPPTAASVTVGTRKLADGLAYVTEAVVGRLLMVDCQDTTLVTGHNPSSTAYTDVPLLTVSVTAVAGDILLVDASIGLMHFAVSADYMSARIMMNDGGGDVDPTQRVHVVPVAGGSLLPIWTSRTFKYVVVNTGAVTVRVQALGALDAGSHGLVLGTNYTNSAGSSLRVAQYRASP